MNRKKMKLSFLCVVLLFFGSSVISFGDWNPGEPYKMHFPQLPNPIGWDVAFRSPPVQLELADDWQCTATGPVSDIHFWISWQGDYVGSLSAIRVCIYSNNPYGPSGGSEPNVKLYDRIFLAGQYTVRHYGTGEEGWYNPYTGAWNKPDHYNYYQINITDINEPFIQQEGTIYWLGIRVAPPTGGVAGWKTALPPVFMDTAVWRLAGGAASWMPLYDPMMPMPLDLAFVITGKSEEPNYAKPLEQHTKWSQPPIEIDANSTVPTYCGWDEQSHDAVDTGAPTVKIVADDYRCIGSMPVTSIHWWGSYYGWESPWGHNQLPPVLPERWWIGFWSNVPANAPPYYLPYSYPDVLLHSVTIPAGRVKFSEVGSDEYYGYHPHDICYQYNVDLNHEEIFRQGDFNEVTYDNIYWVSIVAEYNDVSPPVYKWGWKTRPMSPMWPEHWMDDAVTFNLPGKPGEGFPTDPYSITPIKDPVWQQSADVAFELDTDPNYIKWEQRYTGIRDWPHYEDVKSMLNVWNPDGQKLVADDWRCVRRTPITAIVWWGSYIGFTYDEACSYDPLHIEIPPTPPDKFRLTIWTDVAANDPCNHYGYSHPGKVIWQYDANKYDEVLVGYDKHPENSPPYRTEPVFRYSVRLPEANWFHQPDFNGVFWLSVQAVYDVYGSLYDWGWTNHKHAFNDDAVRCNFFYFDLDTGQWAWDEELHDQTGASEDMSFMLFTDPNKCVNCANYNLDSIVNFLDYADFADDWLWVGPAGGYNNSDLDCNGIVNFYDLKIFVDQWLGSCP
ncbi:MAG: hypothetical protein WAK60_02035 [Sedimentisphaerales bacterium]